MTPWPPMPTTRMLVTPSVMAMDPDRLRWNLRRVRQHLDNGFGGAGPDAHVAAGAGIGVDAGKNQLPRLAALGGGGFAVGDENRRAAQIDAVAATGAEIIDDLVRFEPLEAVGERTGPVSNCLLYTSRCV